MPTNVLWAAANDLSLSMGWVMRFTALWSCSTAALPSIVIVSGTPWRKYCFSSDEQTRGTQHEHGKQPAGGPLCGEVLSAVGRAGSRGQLLAPACGRQPLGPS